MKKPLLSVLKRERASDSVFDTLRECILTQKFHPGERLNVKELAVQLGVSPTPVKEAINRLSLEGLVDINPRSGTYVSDISADDVMETFEIRNALECLAAEKCIERLTPETLAKFEELSKKLNAPVVTENDRAKHEICNLEFHSQIVEASGNKKLIEMYQSLNAHIKIARIHYSREGWENRMEQERKEHKEIFQALKNRNRETLVPALRRHIERASQCLIEDLIRNGNGKTTQFKNP